MGYLLGRQDEIDTSAIYSGFRHESVAGTCGRLCKCHATGSLSSRKTLSSIYTKSGENYGYSLTPPFPT